MRADRPLPLPSSWPPESVVRARRGAVPAADVRTRAVLRRQSERSVDAWLEAAALVEPIAPLRPVDPTEPPRCPKRENYRTAVRAIGAKARARS